MSELGDLLELLHDAHAHLTTFEVEYRDWSRDPATNELVVGYEDGGPRLRWRGAGPYPEEIVTTRRIWLRRPDQLRVEVTQNEMLLRLGVRNGERWWRWDSERGTITGTLTGGSEEAPSLPVLLAPPALLIHRLVARMRFEPAGTGERAGRRVIRARAALRSQPEARGALSYEMEFDAEHGSLLRRIEFEDGQRVWERDAHEVMYDAEIDPGCFVFVAPDGQQPDDSSAEGARERTGSS